MVVCRNWAAGNCRFGDRCRFEHTSQDVPPIANGNRFAPIQNNAQSSRNNNAFQQGSTASTIPYGLDKVGMLADLRTEAPQWILSAYGPGRNAPRQLFGGAREQSPEEMRMLHYIAMAAGNPQQAAQEADKLFLAAQQQMQAAANNVDAAIEFVISGEREHPNRIDIVNQTAPSAPGGISNPFAGTSSPFPTVPAANPFGGSSQPTPTSQVGAFGQPSGLGARPSPFAAPSPAFGAPTQLGAPSSFGQQSTLGGGGAFGKPSALGGTNSFGQPSAAVVAAPFGQPSALGQRPNPFGTSSNTPAAAPFSTFPNKPAPFAQSQTASAFGNPSGPPQPAPFGLSTPFGAQAPQPPNPLTNVSTQFGAPSPAPSNPFGAPTQSPALSNAFGVGSTTQPANPFSKPTSSASPFGTTPVNPAPSSNPFGAPKQTPPASNPFSAPQQRVPASSNSFGQPQPPTTNSTPNPFSARSNSSLANMSTLSIKPSCRDLDATHPDPNTYTTTDREGRLVTFKGERVVYENEKPGIKRADGKWQKIAFPNGPPAQNRDAALSLEHYEGNDALKAEYQYAANHGVFKDGKMPIIPPLQQWCSFDF